MLRLITRRLIFAVVTLWVVSIVVFSAIELLPGDACQAFLGQMAQGKRLENCRVEHDLNAPAYARYSKWAIGLASGDLGKSIKRSKPLEEIIGPRFRNTVILGLTAALVGIPLAIVLGALAALYRDRRADLWISFIAIFCMTVPEFIIGTLLISFFSVWLGWLPGIVIMRADAPLLDVLSKIVLPVMTLTLVMVAHIMRMVRTSMIDVLASDFVMMSQLKGVSRLRQVVMHALPNALLPTINLIALNIAWLMGGVLVVEVVFNYPGIGRLSVNAISDRDFPLVQAIALLMASLYVALNLIADLLALVLNPKLRTRGAKV
ncbi:MAG: ABC transporter permease [Pseudomonadales bacterium]|nr:ABC transporter permease [Pseudomonadales bacterium]